MDAFTAYFVSVLAGLTAGIIAKPGWLLVSGLFRMLFSDLPNISGRWTAEFTEPTEDGEEENMSENIKLHQLGRILWGEGIVLDKRSRNFKYCGSILRDTFHGTYRIPRSTAPGGSGTFQLKIAGSDKIMNGWCIWYDRHTDKIEASLYKWEKQGS